MCHFPHAPSYPNTVIPHQVQLVLPEVFLQPLISPYLNCYKPNLVITISCLEFLNWQETGFFSCTLSTSSPVSAQCLGVLFHKRSQFCHCPPSSPQWLSLHVNEDAPYDGPADQNELSPA